MLKKILSSMLIGGSIGVGPYTLATQIPAPEVKKAKGEGAGFGERCLFDEEICALMKKEEFEQDKEENNSEDPQNGKNDIDSQITKRMNEQWKKLLTKRDDDYCGFGFLTPKSGQKQTEVEDINTLEKCWKEITGQNSSSQ